MHQREGVTTGEFFRFVSQNPFQSGTVVLEHSLAIENRQHVRRIRRKIPEIFFAADEFRFGPFALEPLSCLLQSAANRRDQPLRPMFEHIIRRAVLKTLDCRLLANRS